MTSKNFFVMTVFFCLLIFFTIVISNYVSDDFGLFRSHDSRRIWTREKTSKYLMSFKYIPENFNAVLVGSSVSANLDTRKVTSYEMYNLSMNSGNITELKYPLEVLMKSGKIKAVVFCLYDYTTKDSGVKGNQLDKKEYFGSLFSDIPFDILKNKVKYKLLKRGYDVFRSSSNGFNDFNMSKKCIKFTEVSKKYMENPRSKMIIDERAFEELNDLLIDLRQNDIKIYAYFYPIYKEWFEVFVNNGEWNNYKERIMTLFNRETDMIWDLNTAEYDYISKNPESYSDGHLSDKGAEEVLKVIDKFLSE